MWNIFKPFLKPKPELIEKEEIKNCSTCRFNNEDEFICFAGTYYANKGLNKLCYNGELWESKIN